MANERTSNNQDDKMGSNSPDQTMQHEQAKGSASGGDRSEEKGEFDKNRSEFDKNRQEKSAIGSGQSQSGQSGQTGQGKDDSNQTGEPGRARSELDEKNRSEQKNPSEPTGR